MFIDYEIRKDVNNLNYTQMLINLTRPQKSLIFACPPWRRRMQED